MAKISVVIPIYNGERFLAKAVESVLSQTYRDFELILIDDASPDNSQAIIRTFKDPRIVYIKNQKNLGLASTLNLGLQRGSGKYIARMDQDDVCHPQRLELQLALMESNKDVVIAGTQFSVFGAVESRPNPYPLEHDEIWVHLLFYNCIAHPTVMLRLDAMKGHDLRYDAGYDWAEDYDLWSRASEVVRTANLSQRLLSYRINEGSMTGSGETKVHATMKRIYAKNLSRLNIEADDDVLDLHMKIGHKMLLDPEIEVMDKIETHFSKILEANERQKVYKQRILLRLVSEWWSEYGISSKKESIPDFLSRPLSKDLQIASALRWQRSFRQLKASLKQIIGK